MDRALRYSHQYLTGGTGGLPIDYFFVDMEPIKASGTSTESGGYYMWLDGPSNPDCIDCVRQTVYGYEDPEHPWPVCLEQCVDVCADPDSPDCIECLALCEHDQALIELRGQVASLIHAYYPEAVVVWYYMGWTVNRRYELQKLSHTTEYWPADLNALATDPSTPTATAMIAPQFYFGSDETRYYQAAQKVSQRLSQDNTQDAMAPLIGVAYGAEVIYDDPGLEWHESDPRITARVVTAYLEDPDVQAICVWPGLRDEWNALPWLNEMVHRHLYALAWATSSH